MAVPTADYDAIILGAGAAGLMAAIRAAERGRKILLLEKAKKAGVKILMSGGTRCNITHDCDHRGIVEAFGKNGKFLYSALANFGVRDVVEFFHAEGVPTKIEETGKIFPVSDRALDVLQALLRRLVRAGVSPQLAEPALDVGPHETGFFVRTTQRTVTASKLLITTGGLSYPGCGTTGDGYGFARRFGHTIVPTRPSLVPVTTNEPWVKDLSGLTLPDTQIRVIDQNKPISSRRGSLLFAHFGLSGPVALDVSRAVSGHEQPTRLELEVDFLPNAQAEKLDEFLRTESLASGKKLLASVLSEQVPRRVADQLLNRNRLPIERKAAALAKQDRLNLVRGLKQTRISVQGTLGYEKAEVTAGGVSLAEVDSRTMQSKLYPGLYFAGEVLDLDGWIGGYNFQSAWSTGTLAADQL